MFGAISKELERTLLIDDGRQAARESGVTMKQGDCLYQTTHTTGTYAAIELLLLDLDIEEKEVRSIGRIYFVSLFPYGLQVLITETRPV